MAEVQAPTIPVEALTFVGEVMAIGSRAAGNVTLSNGTEQLQHEFGRYLLSLLEVRSDLPAELDEKLPEAIGDYFGNLPRWIVFDRAITFRKKLDTLPPEVVVAVEPHLTFLYPKQRPVSRV